MRIAPALWRRQYGLRRWSSQGHSDKVRSAESAVRSYRIALMTALCYSAVHGAVLIVRSGTVQVIGSDGDTIPYTLYPLPYTLYPIMCTLYSIPYTLYPIPSTLYPTPYTLYPIPYTLYPIPYTLYPALLPIVRKIRYGAFFATHCTKSRTFRTMRTHFVTVMNGVISDHTAHIKLPRIHL